MKVIGLDLSLRSAGVAVLDRGGTLITTRAIGYGLSDGDDRQRIERLIYIANEIIGIAKGHSDDGKPEVVIEGYSFDSKFNREALAELHGVVRTQLFLALGVVASRIPPQSARKIIGVQIQQSSVRRKDENGKWVKEKRKVPKVKEQVREFLGSVNVVFSEEDNDVMDAYVIARAGFLKRGGACVQ